MRDWGGARIANDWPGAKEEGATTAIRWLGDSQMPSKKLLVLGDAITIEEEPAVICFLRFSRLRALREVSLHRQPGKAVLRASRVVS